MKKFKSLALVLSLAMVLTAVPANIQAAKKVKLSKKTVSVDVGGKVTVSVKNSAKKAKVSWKLKKTSVAKISKKVSKGKKAKAVIQGIKPGKAVLKATYKVGKSKKTLKCKVTVNPAADNLTPSSVPTQSVVTGTSAPVVTTTPDVSVTESTSTPKPTRTPRVTATPSPTPTAKPAAEAKPTGDILNILSDTSIVTNPTRDEDKEKVVHVVNADGSVTLDFTDTVYYGIRFTFEQPLNLEDFSYIVVEGTNASGSEEGHQLACQFLDAIDHNEGHGGLLEIDTQDSITFPIKYELTDKSIRTNVNSFEIYSTDGDKPKGPVTVTSIKLYKSEQDYIDDINSGGSDATPAPFEATFTTDSHVKSITTYNTQDYTNPDNIFENQTTAYARNSETGEIITDGNGQVNFTAVVEPGYMVDKVTVTPEENFNNIKGKSDTGLDNTFRITKITGPISITVTTKPEEAKPESFAANFIVDEHATITTYKTQNYDDASAAMTGQTTAVARDSATGDILTDGNGQINFTVVLDEGYVVDDISIEPSDPKNYKNIKEPVDTGKDNTYRITKITGDLTITVKVIPAA